MQTIANRKCIRHRARVKKELKHLPLGKVLVKGHCGKNDLPGHSVCSTGLSRFCPRPENLVTSERSLCLRTEHTDVASFGKYW